MLIPTTFLKVYLMSKNIVHIVRYLLTVSHALASLQFIVRDSASCTEPLLMIMVCHATYTTECRMIAAYSHKNHPN